MKILYNKEDNEYYLITNNKDKFYIYNDAYIVTNSLSDLLNLIKNIDLENCELYEDDIAPDETIIFETNSKKELLNLSNTHPELFI